jgi:hypothetical protein
MSAVGRQHTTVFSTELEEQARLPTQLCGDPELLK